MWASKTDEELCAATGSTRAAAFVELVRRYQSTVCAVTYAVTGRRDHSEDLAQETFIIAWKKLHQVDRPQRVGAWLAGIARNLGRKTYRARRTEPLGQAAMLAAECPDPESTMLRWETRTELWRLLSALPIRYREAMVLYYREEQSAPRVAQLMGTSVAVVEQRLSRGRRMLRDKAERRMQRELTQSRPGGAFTRRIAAVLPLIVVPPPPWWARAGGPVAAALKGIAMKKLLVTLAIALLALSSYLAVGGKHADDGEIIEASASPSNGAIAAVPSKVPRDEDRTDIVSGLVLDAQGRPIAHGVVTLSGAGGVVAFTRQRGRPTGLAVAHADGNGHWVIEGLTPGRYRATATASGHLPGHHPAFELTSDSARRGLQIHLRPGGYSVNGVVSDIGGGPVEGAVIHADLRGSAIATLSGEDGHYQLTLPDGVYKIQANETDYQSAHHRLTVRESDRLLDFALVPGAAIFGTVRERGTEKIVEGATVTFERKVLIRAGYYSSRAALQSEIVTTDAAGRFALRRLGSAAYNLRATADHLASFTPTEVNPAIAQQVSGIVVYVEAAANARGRVVDEANPEIGVANVRVEAVGIGGTAPVQALSRADGSFELRGLATGTYSLGATGASVITTIMGSSFTIGATDLAGVVVAVQRGTTIRGAVRPAGAVDVQLALRSDAAPMMLLLQAPRLKHARTRSGDNGKFTLESVPTGDWAVVARGEDGSYAEVDVSVPDEGLTGLVATMAPRATLHGIVIEPSGAAVADATVQVIVVDGLSSRPLVESTTSDGAGGFEFPGLPDGTYKLSATDRRGVKLQRADVGSGNADVTVAVTRDAPSAVELRVTLPDGTISGVVVGPQGQPSADAWVRVHSADDKRSPIVTDAEGRFSFANLGGSTYSVSATSRNGDATAEHADAHTGDMVELALTPLGSLAGRVTAEGRPVPRFVLKSIRPFDRAFASPEGLFELDRVHPGPRSIKITAAEGSAVVSVDVAPGARTELDIQLLAWGAVAGRVVSKVGDPMAGLNISVWSDGGDRDYAARLAADFAGKGLKTDAQGRFSVEGIGSGPGHVTIGASDLVAGGKVRGRMAFVVRTGTRVELGDIVVVDDGEQLPEPAEH